MKKNASLLCRHIYALIKLKNSFAWHQYIYFLLTKVSKKLSYKANSSLEKAVASLSERFAKTPYFTLDCFKFLPIASPADRYMFLYEYFEIVTDNAYFAHYNIYTKNSKSNFAPSHGVFTRFSDGGPYEIEQVQVLPGDIVIDAGANMGIFSLLAAKKGGIVHAFEPQEAMFDILQSNIRLNAISTITSHKCALGNINGDVALYEMPNNHLGASIAIARSDVAQTIPCMTLDTWFAQSGLERIDFIKADIEGAERLLLDGAEHVLRTYKPKLALCTYHLPDDPYILSEKILKANPDYTIVQGKTKLYAW